MEADERHDPEACPDCGGDCDTVQCEWCREWFSECSGEVGEPLEWSGWGVHICTTCAAEARDS